MRSHLHYPLLDTLKRGLVPLRGEIVLVLMEQHQVPRGVTFTSLYKNSV
jgi:hypothetical protein